MLALDGTDADTSEREDAGLDCSLAHDFADGADVETVIEIG